MVQHHSKADMKIQLMMLASKKKKKHLISFSTQYLEGGTEGTCSRQMGYLSDKVSLKFWGSGLIQPLAWPRH